MKPRFNAIKTHNTYKQFLTFLAVGVLNTMFGYGVFSTFIYIGLHYTIATFMMTVLGILFNFMTVGSIVFKNTNKSLILQFCLVYGILYTVGTIFIGVINIVIDNLYISGAINALAMPPFAFYLNKRFVFRNTATASLQTSNR